MASTGMQMAGCAMALLGWILVLVVCATPMWRVTAFIGNNIVTSQVIWEGLWMNCVVESTGQMQCKVYDSMLALSSDLQGARALMVVSIVVGIAGILIAFVAGKSRCTNCLGHPRMGRQLSHAQEGETTISPNYKTTAPPTEQQSPPKKSLPSPTSHSSIIWCLLLDYKQLQLNPLWHTLQKEN
uniref:Claudin n=1 Tax=Fundulus heteroclitus TaxID=8078 RepID=A0A3Q2PYP9_FUNHE